MVLQDNYTEYARRTHKVLEHIDQHLDQSLELGTLAEVAHFSAFHFHRLFLAWMRENICANRSGFKSNSDQVISNPDQAHRRRWGIMKPLGNLFWRLACKSK